MSTSHSVGSLDWAPHRILWNLRDLNTTLAAWDFGAYFW